MPNFKKLLDKSIKDYKKSKKPRNVFYYFLWLVDIIKLIVIAFAVVWLVHRFLFQPFYVVGPSMEPSFYDKEYLIVEKISYLTSKPSRGDVVVLMLANGSKDFLIKRIIGLPGEKISIKNDQIYIYDKIEEQDKLLKEGDYLSIGATTPGDISVSLLDNEYYVLGDNRNKSRDSRVFGPVQRDNLIGKAWFRGLPFEEAGLIKIPIYQF